jgi:thiol-disulfide isomerase/thioredoxin
VLLLAFAAGIANAMARGRTPDCHCFGNLHSAPAGGSTLTRNLGLAALAGFVVWQGPDAELSDWVAARSAAELVALGTGAVALALAAVSLRLRSENRKLQRALADTRAARAAEPEGLPIGTPAPGFELSGLGGETRTLQSLRDGGQPVLLVFFESGCGPCHALAPHVARWQAALAGRVSIAVINEGEVEQTQAAWSEDGTEVLLDPDSEVTRRTYRVLTWPSAIAIGRDGRIASDLVTDQYAMEVLIRMLLDDAAPRRVPAPTAAAAES